MNLSIALSGIGILLSLTGMAVLIFRGASPILTGCIAAICVSLFSGLDLFTAMTDVYISGVAEFFKSYFFVFLLGNLLGNLYQISGAASSIGEALALKVFPKRCMLACLLTTAVLSYGGINSFVIIFAMYPIALKLFELSDIPNVLLPGIICGGMWTFAMTGPFTPQIPNIVSMNYLGTTAYAGLIPGVVSCIGMAVLILLYMNRQVKKLKGQGLHYRKPENLSEQHEGQSRPYAVIGAVPLLSVIFTFNLLNWNIIVSLTISILLGVVLFWKHLPKKKLFQTVNSSAVSAVTVIANTAAVVGFGTVVKTTEFYQYAVDLLVNSQANPYVLAALGTNLFAGILGSASGGISLMYSSLGEAFVAYAAQGYNVGFIHRLCALGSGGLDSMPWNGSIVSVFAVCGVTHKEAYRYNFVTCAVIPLICTLLLALPLCILLS